MSEQQSNQLLAENGERTKTGQFAPGHKPLNKGARHKATEIKLAFMEAFEKIGGIDDLVKWINSSKLNKKAFYTMLLSSLPKDLDIQADINGNITIMPTIEKDGQPVDFNIGTPS